MKILSFILFLTVPLCCVNALNYYEYLNSPSSNQFSDACQKDLSKLRDGLEHNFMWAWKMLDASSKIRSGFAIISDDIGQFDECVKAENDTVDIYGKYCLGAIHIGQPMGELKHYIELKNNSLKNTKALTASVMSTVALSFAGCLPNSCTTKDFEKFYSEQIQLLERNAFISFDDVFCSTKYDDTELTTGAIISLAFFGVVFLIMLSETCYDIYCDQTTKEPLHPMLIAFSMYSNSAKLFKFSKGSNQLECLNGLKFYSMLWVLLGHTYALTLSTPVANHMDTLDWADSLHSMLVVSGTLAVDTFLISGGILVSYVFSQAMEKGTKFNILVYYIHRYVRLTPALAALMLVTANILPYLGSGPYWRNIRISKDLCQDEWWSTLLYVQNYATVPKICLGHSWYLSVDMQLFILSPILLFGLRKFAKYTIPILSAVILGICGYSFYVTWHNHYSAILSNIYADNGTFMSDYYIRTHARAGVWILGVITGYCIFEIKQHKLKYRPLRIWNIIGWLLCIFLILLCIFVGHGSLRSADYNEWGNSLHIAFIRQLWSVAICWMVLSCTFGYGGPINWFLSFPVYQVFNRFAYSIYLIHYMLITLWTASTRTPIPFSDMMMGFYFWGYLCFTCIISYFWVLAFESPMIILEKIVLGPLLGNKKQNAAA